MEQGAYTYSEIYPVTEIKGENTHWEESVTCSKTRPWPGYYWPGDVRPKDQGLVIETPKRYSTPN